VILGPEASGQSPALVGAVEDGFKALGLDPSLDLEVIVNGPPSALDAKGSIAGVWFGGAPDGPNDPAHVETLQSLIRMGVSILPVVPSLVDYRRRVPPPLDDLNGYVQSDPRIAPNVLKAFRLTRETRQAFISYRRIDSGGIARQLFHKLDDRGYQVFLDTASIEQGAPVQEVLMERLADVDLFILLDSPNALDSQWVYDELSTMNQLGLGMLQLYWTERRKDDPSQVRSLATRGTEFSFRFELHDTHFVDGKTMLGPDAHLKPEVLDQVADLAEQARIRSLGARRERVVAHIRAEARRLNIEVLAKPAGPIQFLKEGKCVGTAHPVIGLPSAWHIFDCDQELGKGQTDPDAFKDHYMVYDGLGIRANRLGHLDWLNKQLRLRTLKAQLLGDWLK
jgi:hypothetical protein